MAEEEAAQRGGRVTAVHLKLGALSGVVKDALLFSYEIACQGSCLEGSRLEIEELPVIAFGIAPSALPPARAIESDAMVRMFRMQEPGFGDTARPGTTGRRTGNSGDRT